MEYLRRVVAAVFTWQTLKKDVVSNIEVRMIFTWCRNFDRRRCLFRSGTFSYRTILEINSPEVEEEKDWKDDENNETVIGKIVGEVFHRCPCFGSCKVPICAYMEAQRSRDVNLRGTECYMIGILFTFGLKWDRFEGKRDIFSD